MDTELELVRKGYDPAQVHDLVGRLSTELKGLAAENDRLRGELEAARATAAAPAEPPADAGPDIFEHWRAETESLFNAGRESVAAVVAGAEADAAAIRAQAELDAESVRHQAQLDAEMVMSEAQREADEISLEALQHKQATEAELAALTASTDAQVTEARAQLAKLQQQRAAITGQLNTAKSQLTQLLSVVGIDSDQPDKSIETAAPDTEQPAEHADDES